MDGSPSDRRMLYAHEWLHIPLRYLFYGQRVRIGGGIVPMTAQYPDEDRAPKPEVCQCCNMDEATLFPYPDIALCQWCNDNCDGAPGAHREWTFDPDIEAKDDTRREDDNSDCPF